MRYGEQSRIRRRLAASLSASMLFGLALFLPGCGTRHVAIANGTTGVMLSNGYAAFPDEKGVLTVGKYKPVPGDLIRRAKDGQEILDALKGACVIVEPAHP